MTHLNDLSKVYREQIAESAVPGKPAEKLGAVTGISKADQMSAAERIKKKTAEKRELEASGLEKKHGKKPGEMDDHPEYKKKKYVDEASLDPVGQEDDDINNDGKKDKTDKYLRNRRKAVGAAIAADRAKKSGKSVKEGFSNWRQDLSEVITDETNDKPIKEKKVNNKITVNPKLGEAVEELGGTLLEMVEIDEFDAVVESVYDELIEEGFSEDEVERGIETALTTLEEGYYDSAVAASKAVSQQRIVEKLLRSL